MKKVVIHPERCVGCMQCMAACAVAHSQSKTLFAATLEKPLPRPRIHVGVGPFDAGFPNRCRHCNPAPCLAACLPGAIFWTADYETVLIDPDKCINCASCAMACPFGVLRYHQDWYAPPQKTVAVKCDNCVQRLEQGLIPACVEICKVGALTFEDPDVALKTQDRPGEPHGAGRGAGYAFRFCRIRAPGLREEGSERLGPTLISLLVIILPSQPEEVSRSGE